MADNMQWLSENLWIRSLKTSIQITGYFSIPDIVKHCLDVCPIIDYSGPTLSVAILHPSGFMLGTRWILVLDTSCCTSLSPACSGEQYYLVMRKSYRRVISAHLIFLFFAPSYFFWWQYLVRGAEVRCKMEKQLSSQNLVTWSKYYLVKRSVEQALLISPTHRACWPPASSPARRSRGVRACPRTRARRAGRRAPRARTACTAARCPDTGCAPASISFFPYVNVGWEKNYNVFLRS